MGRRGRLAVTAGHGCWPARLGEHRLPFPPCVLYASVASYTGKVRLAAWDQAALQLF